MCRRLVLLLWCLSGCRSEEERARERANDAAHACVETTRASKAPVIDAPLEEFRENAPVLRIRSNGLELDTRSAFANHPDLIAYFGKGKPAIEPMRLDELKPFGTADWFLFPKLQKALSDFEEAQPGDRVETTLLLDVAPDASAAHVAAILAWVKVRTVLVVRGRDGLLGLLSFDGPQRVSMSSNEGCIYAAQQNPPTCIAPAVNLRATGAQLYAWSGLAHERCVSDPFTHRKDVPRGPFAAGEGCNFPISSTEELNALGRAVHEVEAIEPGCEVTVLTIDPTARWSEVSAVVAALVKQGARDVVLWGVSPEREKCPADPIRPATWKKVDGGIR